MSDTSTSAVPSSNATTSDPHRVSKRIKAATGFNPHAFASSQELPNVSKTSQYDSQKEMRGRPSLVDTGKAGRNKRSASGGKDRRSSKRRTGYFQSAADNIYSVDTATSIMLPCNSAKNGNEGDGLAFERQLSKLLPPVVPQHIPMNLRNVTKAIASMGPAFGSREQYLLNQFRAWAPVDELEIVGNLLKAKRDKILERY